MIMLKIEELKRADKSIEEIYKYTNDIIVEEEDEYEESSQEEEVDSHARNRSILRGS